MKINSLTIIPTNYYTKINNKSDYSSNVNYISRNDLPAFTGNYYNIQKIELNKAKLIKSLEAMLQEQPKKREKQYITLTPEEILQLQVEWTERAEAVLKDKNITGQQQLNMLSKLQKESDRLKRLEKNPVIVSKGYTPQNTNKNEDLDLALINRFKVAVDSDNLNLDKVFLAYYSDMRGMSTIEELKNKYPKLEFPQRPEKVVSKKIADNFTQDFYDELLEIPKGQLSKEISAKTDEVLASYTEHYGVTPDAFGPKVAEELKNQITVRLKKISEGGYKAYQFRKKPFADITGEDIKLLSIDFDDFVTEVTKRQYLGNERLKDIVYDNGEVKIKAGSLIDNKYKFTKVSEKVKSIIKDAHAIKTDSRKYELFSIEQLRERLEYYGTKEIANDEFILKSIIDFGTCNFEPDDIQPMIKFFRELDMVLDGDKTIQEVHGAIFANDLTPKGTIEINEKERTKYLNKVKAEQEIVAQVSFIQNDFDDAINLLYMNNMTDVANIITKYRPKNLDDSDTSKFITELIKGHINPDKTINNEHLLEAQLLRWNKFREAPLDKITEKAKEYAKGDPIKAGQYLINHEIISNFPDSDHPDLDIVAGIIGKTNGNKELAIDYLCKLDEYYELDDAMSSKLSVITEIFSHKDPVEKAILKQIFEKYYLNSSTIIKINNTELFAELPPVAKQAITETYMFPDCVPYLCKFEEAMTRMTNEFSSSGIKQIGLNNDQMKGFFEAKVKGTAMRLFAAPTQNNIIVFDAFSKEGLH